MKATLINIKKTKPKHLSVQADLSQSIKDVMPNELRQHYRKNKYAMGSNYCERFSVKVAVVNPGPDAITGESFMKRLLHFYASKWCHFLFC